VDDARQIIPRKRNHPALAIWGGGNELESLNKLPLDDNEPVLQALREVVAQLDPDRHWLPTSAFGRKPFNGLSSIASDPHGLHDVHGPWLHEGLTEHYTLYNAGTSLLHSEFGVEGLTNLTTLKTIMSPAHRCSVTLDNAVWRHLSAWWVRSEQWQAMFGTVDNLATLVQVTQWLQAEGVRYAIESNRRRMYQNSGSLPWQFNEPFPMAACTSAVDYFAEPKPLYYAVRRAYAPLQVTAKYATLVWPDQAEFEVEIWFINAYEQHIRDVELQARIVGSNGSEYLAQQHIISFTPNQATKGPNVRWPLTELREAIFFLDLKITQQDGTVLAANQYPFSRSHNLQPLMHVPRTTLDVSYDESPDGGTLWIKNIGHNTALFIQFVYERDVRSTAYTYFSDNNFCLLPGEARRVDVEFTGDGSNASPLTVTAWNTDAVMVA
jgi:beta-mannosidase